jgi:drug/metabolite transporter superfamily protein YnfA
MLIGMLMSAISGGMTALVFTLAGGHSLGRVLAAYPLGGMLAVASFLAMPLIRHEYSEWRRF